jgi:hypothetical protein
MFGVIGTSDLGFFGLRLGGNGLNAHFSLVLKQAEMSFFFFNICFHLQ